MAFYECAQIFVTPNSNVVVDTASGTIATFTTNLRDKLTSCKCQINAIQSGSGTPSPSNPRAITGFSGANIVNTPDSDWAELWDIDNSFRGVVAFNQLVRSLNSASEVYGITRTIVEANKSLRYKGTCTNTTNFTGFTADTITVNHVILIDLNCVLPSGSRLNIVNRDRQSKTLIKATTAYTSFGIYITNGTEIDVTIIPQVFDLTAMFGSTIADYIYSLEQSVAGSGIAFFRNLYPDDYYPYNAGTNELVGGDNKVVTNITFGQTVYGGVLDVTNGKLRVDRIFYTFNGSEAWTIATTGIRRVFRLNGLSENHASYTEALGKWLCNIAEEETTVSGIENLNKDYWTVKGQGDVTSNIFVISSTSDVNMSLTDFTTMLSNTNMQLVYPLATPTEITLTAKEIEALLGTNNLYHDCNGQIEVKFRKVATV